MELKCRLQNMIFFSFNQILYSLFKLIVYVVGVVRCKILYIHISSACFLPS